MSAAAKADDRLIGLHIGSCVYYCHRSTLANAEAGSYFARRFGPDRNFADDVAYRDGNGIRVFFIERDGDLFEHVLKYLTRLTLNLPPYSESKPLWRDLRLEAEYFSLDGLSDVLSVAHRCPYDGKGSTQGILYWLGTGRGTKDHPNYVNPLKLRGRGENRDTSILEVSVGILGDQNNFFRDYSDTDQARNLLQHRKKTDLRSRTLEPIGGFTPLWFQPAASRGTRPFPVPLGMAPPDDRPPAPPAPRVLMFGSILVRPTHISIRVSYGAALEKGAAMKRKRDTRLNLNASLDGERWETLELNQTEPLLGETARRAMDKEIASIFLTPGRPSSSSTD